MSDGLDLVSRTEAFEYDNAQFRARVRYRQRARARGLRPVSRNEYDKRLSRLDRQIYLCPVCDQRTLPNGKHDHKEKI